MAEHNELGQWGETEAEKYLEQLGFEILERNYKLNHAEADLIALDGHILVFVEVKTRRNNKWGDPEEYVDEKKERLIERLAEHYLEKHGLANEIRFDIVSILKGDHKSKLTHIPDAF